MKKGFCLLFAVSVAVLFLSGCGTPEARRDSAPLRFVVLGDNQPYGTETLGQPDVFKQIAGGVVAQKPELVMHVGDHISGETSKADFLGQMWDEYFDVTAAWKMPVYHAAGNHDIYNPLSEKVYKERTGQPLYYSFDRGNCHFIVLDSEELGRTSVITGAQLDWLKNDLAAKKTAGPVFVFIHKPLWTEYDWQTYQANSWNRDVHPLLRQYGVTAVFAGHDHRYAKSEKDGIRYIITGGAGGPFYKDRPDPAEGEFHHYCLVTVQGTNVVVAVKKPGEAAVSENTVLCDEIKEYKRLAELWNLRARAAALRREGHYAEAAEAWKTVLAQAGEAFDEAARTVFLDIEKDMRSAGRLQEYDAFLMSQSARYPGETYAVWRDLARGRIQLELHNAGGAAAIYRELLQKRPADAAVSGRIYHDLAVSKPSPETVKVEAENFSAQGGGEVLVMNRFLASGKTLSRWNDPGHWLEWQAEVPADGMYYLILRFAQGFQDKEGTYKELFLDGKEIEKMFFWYTGGWARSTDDWACKMLTNAGGSPRALKLDRGTHTIRIETPPGPNKGLNLDYLLLVPAFSVSAEE